MAMHESAFWSTPILQSVLPVVASSRHVRTSQDEVERVAQWMAAEEVGYPSGGLAIDTKGDPDLLTDYQMFTNSINFAFTDFSTSVKFEAFREGRWWSDSEGMIACTLNALDAGIPIFDGAWMAEVTVADLEKVFAGNIRMPMLEERVEIFHGVGTVLADRYQGRWRNWLASCAPTLYAGGDGLLERLHAEFPRYRDVSPYDGQTVQLYKLGQLALWGLHHMHKPTGRWELKDLGNVTAFADYIVPVALEAMRITEYTPELRARIEAGDEIKRDSAEEVEIRAHTLYATAALTEAINRRRPADRQLVIPQVDWRLWSHYHATHYPHHLTRTVMY